MNESKPSMRCRNHNSIVKTRIRVDARNELKGRPVYCLGGDRHRGGMNLVQAFVWNVGTRSLVLREKREVEDP